MSTTTAPGSVLHGRALVRDSHLNRGTAFTVEERSAFGLEGLLPSGVLSLEEQAKRSCEQYGAPRPHCWLPTLSSDPCAANFIRRRFQRQARELCELGRDILAGSFGAFRPVPTAVPPGHRPGRAPRVNRDLSRRRVRRDAVSALRSRAKRANSPAPAAGDSLPHAASPVE